MDRTIPSGVAVRLRARSDRDSGASSGGGFAAIEWLIGLALTIFPLVVVAAVVPVWLERDLAAAAAAADVARALTLFEGEGQAADAVQDIDEELAFRTAVSACDEHCSGLNVSAGPDGSVHAEAWIWAPGVESLSGGSGPGFWIRRGVSFPGDPYPNPP